jgi:hypothetical protein
MASDGLVDSVGLWSVTIIGAEPACNTKQAAPICSVQDESLLRTVFIEEKTGRPKTL